MPKILVFTQMYENTSLNEWSAASSEWKPKKIREYVVNIFNRISELDADEVYESLKTQIEIDDPFYREVIIDLTLLPDQYDTRRCAEIYFR
jgi:2-hydroxy-3-keto-5-methylthiopentenyl-1-phosphate phosphatase